MLTTEETADRYENYIQSTASTFATRSQDDREDLQQTGRLALVELYAEHTREPMPALVRARIRDRMLNWWRDEYGTMQADTASFGDCPDWEPASELNTEAQALANLDLHAATQDLPHRQAAALQAAIEGETLDDAARQALTRFRRTHGLQRTGTEARIPAST